MMNRYAALFIILSCISCTRPEHARGQIVRDIRDDVFYHIMPIAWRDSNSDAHRFGDFGGLTDSLDYLESLGITAIWINPIFPSPAYHGYQHGPADQLNPWFGTEADFLAFVQAAHNRNIKVFVDFVVYGISHNSPWFQNAHGNPASPYDNWLAFTNAGNTQYLGSTYSTWNGSSVGFIHWNLNDANPAALVTQWAQKWLDPDGDGDPSDGIDGFRLDHVWERYPSGPNGWGYNLIDFWLPWKLALRSVNPHAFIFAEQADWGITGVELLMAFDSAMTKPLEFAARSALSGETTGGLYDTMAYTLANNPPGKTFMGIVGDHDVDRLASSLGGSMPKARLAAALLLTLPFTPMIYYGDEIGMLGVKANYGSDANDIPMREPFKWLAVDGPPMTNYWALHAQAFNNRFSQNNDGRSVQEQEGVPGSLLETYRTLISARKDNVALRRGSCILVPQPNTRTFAFLRHQTGEQTLLVALRIRNTSANTTFNLSGLTIPGGSTTVRDVLTNQFLLNLTDANKSAYSFSMPAYSYRILEISAHPTPIPPAEIDGRNIPHKLGPVTLAATQNSPTGLGDNVSELNQLFIRPQANGLRIAVTGNLTANGTAFALLLDTFPGGQNILNLSGLSPPPSGLQQLTGTRLDTPFAPNHLYFINCHAGNIYVDQVALPTAGSGTKTFRGAGKVGSGTGALTGGNNPNGLQVAMFNDNALGVTEFSAEDADTANSGFDLLIPYADIGLSQAPGTSFRVAAFIVQTSGHVSNQWLPGTNTWPHSLGIAPDLSTIPGSQFVERRIPQPGDVNCDSFLDMQDIDALVLALLDPAAHAANWPGCPLQNADINLDNLADARDIRAMIELLIGS